MLLHQPFYLFSGVYQEVKSNLWFLLFASLFYYLHSLSLVIDWTTKMKVQYHLNHHQKKTNLNHSSLLLALSKLSQPNFVDLHHHQPTPNLRRPLLHHLHYRPQSPSNYPNSQVPCHSVVNYPPNQKYPNPIISYSNFSLASPFLQEWMVMVNHFAIFIRSSILVFLWLMFEGYKLVIDYNALFRSRSLC